MDDTETPDTPMANKRAASMRRFVVIGVLVMAVLFAAYWVLIRTTYTPIMDQVPADEAAEIVKILDDKKIDYRLANGGTTILVASGQADMARLELVGSDLPIRGQVGFELFNQSDMGLTEFAQKINYQRALQGELARTIMLIDGIRSVRVHLGLPERSLFRDERSDPKASITLVLQPGAKLTESRVAGVQRLIAGAVPDMTPEAVAVLDGSGRIVSAIVAPEFEAGDGTDAIISDMRRKITAAIEAAQPGLRFSVRIALKSQSAPSTPGDAQPESGMPGNNAGASSRRLAQVVITTSDPLDEETSADIIRAIAVNSDIDRESGDTILFRTGAVIDSGAALATSLPSDRVVSRTEPLTGESQPVAMGKLGVTLATAALVVVLGGIMLRVVLGRGQDGKRQRLGDFADTLRQRLAATERRT